MFARVISTRSLVYTDRVAADEDRPPHVRAASAIVARGDELFVIQDDTSFIARIRGDEITSIALPRGPGGRRRFEVALGNKLDKLDLESAVILDDEIVAFGSGTIPVREHVVHVSFDGVARVAHEAALYAMLRDAIGGLVNIEGVALVGDELWFCHRGNTNLADAPAIVRMDRSRSRVIACDRFELGRSNGTIVGFTDAVGIEGGIVFLAAAEASANAIDDGLVRGSFLGVLDRDGPRMTPLPIAGKPEGIVLVAPDRAFLVVDDDMPELPATLYEVEINCVK